MKFVTILCLAFFSVILLANFVPAQENRGGTIEGSLSYPSEFIPPDMVVCAENLATRQRHCTNHHLKGKKYRYGEGYRLRVPPGDYHIYAYLPDPSIYGASSPKDYRAYYSEFVKCGMNVDCPSHKPVVVKVKSGEILRRIDPMDWYN